MSKYDEMRKELKYAIIDLDADHYNLSRFMQVIDEIFIKYRGEIEQPKIGGWIPCSERLPENISTVIVQVNEIDKPTFGWYKNMEKKWVLSEKDFVDLDTFTVIAWQPMPEDYHR